MVEKFNLLLGPKRRKCVQTQFKAKIFSPLRDREREREKEERERESLTQGRQRLFVLNTILNSISVSCSLNKKSTSCLSFFLVLSSLKLLSGDILLFIFSFSHLLLHGIQEKTKHLEADGGNNNDPTFYPSFLPSFLTSSSSFHVILSWFS